MNDITDTCPGGCGQDPGDCLCLGPLRKWGGLKSVTYNAYLPERPIFETIRAFVFGDDGRHLHVQMPGDEIRMIASSRVISIEEVTA